MGIFDHFQIRKTTKQAGPTCSKEGKNDSVPKPIPDIQLIRGSISNLDTEYQVIGKIISELENLGFHQIGVSTSGETSGHDWTVAYKSSYNSFDDFLRNAKNDYFAACSKQEAGSPSLDWDSTTFQLSGPIAIRLYALNDGTSEHKIYQAGWSIRIPKDVTGNNELLEKTQDVLRKYQ